MALTIFGVPGLPEIGEGTDLAAAIAGAAAAAGTPLATGDVVVVTSKIVSKAEGRVIDQGDVVPSPFAVEWATRWDKDPAVIEVVLREAKRIVRQAGPILITETHHGFVCANAGIDASNVPDGHVVLLPVDPDRSARHLQSAVARAVGGRVGVVVADTHGRAFRSGIVNVAIGVAGFRAIVDHRGERDREGRTLVATEQALADELAAAAGMLMDKGGGFPVVVVGGVATDRAPGTVADLVRDPRHDLFR